MQEWWKTGNAGSEDSVDRPKAVAYYRHSAQDRQENSIPIQQEQVRQFADDNGIEIVHEFLDRGKSGLTAAGRDGFKDMMENWVKTKSDFQFVLCLDVSRWGRFQDIDLSAQYSAECTRHGKTVIYTSIGKPKENDPLYSVYVQFERFRAAQYSRELSDKVFRGCAHIAGQGFWPGGSPPYGFCRLLLDESRQPVRKLEPGERKSIQNQRVTLALGSPDEVSTIRRIFKEFAESNYSERSIAAALNNEGIASPGGKLWTEGKVRRVLCNELYVGTMVYNKTTMRLRTRRRDNPTADWVKSPDSFAPVIDQSVFDQAQKILNDWSERFSEDSMLKQLQEVFEHYGFFRPSLFQRSAKRPSARTYTTKFGSLDAAFQKSCGQTHSKARDIVLERIGALVTEVESFADFIVLEKRLTVLIQPSVPALLGYRSYWSFRPDTRQAIDLTLGVALSGNSDFEILGYFAMPRLMVRKRPVRLSTVSESRLALHGYTNLEFISELLR